MTRLRRLFSRITAVVGAVLITISALICMTAIGFWVRSYWCTDYRAISRVALPDERRLEIETCSGGLLVTLTSTRYHDDRDIEEWDSPSDLDIPWTVRPPQPYRLRPTSTSSLWNRLGFHYNAWSENTNVTNRGRLPFDWNMRLAVVPFWSLVGLTGMPPVLFFLFKWRHRKRHRPGLCPTCNYDLRAHTANQNCPECGTLILPQKNELSPPRHIVKKP